MKSTYYIAIDKEGALLYLSHIFSNRSALEKYAELERLENGQVLIPVAGGKLKRDAYSFRDRLMMIVAWVRGNSGYGLPCYNYEVVRVG